MRRSDALRRANQLETEGAEVLLDAFTLEHVYRRGDPDPFDRGVDDEP